MSAFNRNNCPAFVGIRSVADGRVVQRHLLYLGEINDIQERAWRKSIEVFDESAAEPRTLSLFPEDRCWRSAPARAS
jgi:hypothetical protein